MIDKQNGRVLVGWLDCLSYVCVGGCLFDARLFVRSAMLYEDHHLLAATPRKPLLSRRLSEQRLGGRSPLPESRANLTALVSTVRSTVTPTVEGVSGGREKRR